MNTEAEGRVHWYHYAAVSETFACWQAMTLGPVEVEPVPVLEIDGGEFPLLGQWDHEPTVQEIDAVTPWDYRTICPACGVEYCDDEGHSEAEWIKTAPARGSSDA